MFPYTEEEISAKVAKAAAIRHSCIRFSSLVRAEDRRLRV